MTKRLRSFAARAALAAAFAVVWLPAGALTIVSGTSTDGNGNTVDRIVGIDESGRYDIVENGTLVGSGQYGGDPASFADWARNYVGGGNNDTTPFAGDGGWGDPGGGSGDPGGGGGTPPIPEPATWALMLAGLAAVAAMRRRDR